MAYIDDIWGCARSRTKAIRDAQLAVNLLHRLGFGIHPDEVRSTRLSLSKYSVLRSTV